MFNANHNETVVTDNPKIPKVPYASKDHYACHLCGSTRFRYKEVEGYITKDGFVVQQMVYYCLGCGTDIYESRVNEFFK